MCVLQTTKVIFMSRRFTVLLNAASDAPYTAAMGYKNIPFADSNAGRQRGRGQGCNDAAAASNCWGLNHVAEFIDIGRVSPVFST